MNRRELVESLTVERFTLHRRRELELEAVNGYGPDWWKAYELVELARAIDAVSVLDSAPSADMVRLDKGAHIDESV